VLLGNVENDLSNWAAPPLKGDPSLWGQTAAGGGEKEGKRPGKEKKTFGGKEPALSWGRGGFVLRKKGLLRAKQNRRSEAGEGGDVTGAGSLGDQIIPNWGLTLLGPDGGVLRKENRAQKGGGEMI